MSAIAPPSQRVWWKQPLDRVEGTWIAIAFVWCLVMFFMMPYWHVYGKQNLANEAYRSTPEMFMKKAEDGIAKFKVREETDQKIPVIHPPAGANVYLVARLGYDRRAWALQSGVALAGVRQRQLPGGAVSAGVGELARR